MKISKPGNMFIVVLVLALVLALSPLASAGGPAKSSRDKSEVTADNAVSSWYLAEGYTGGDFDTYVLLQNPGGEDAEVTMYFQLPSGVAPAPSSSMTVPKGARVTVHLDDLPGLASTDVSTTVLSNKEIVVERSMYFDYYGKAGGHDSIGIEQPGNIWYFAEGYTGGDFDTYILVQNTMNETNPVTLHFQLPDGTSFEPYSLELGGNSRATVHLDAIPGLENTDVSTIVTSSFPVVAERSMYFNYNGRIDGSCSIGTSSPSTTWYLAEGYTGEGFDTYVLLQNPGAEEVGVKLNFQLPSGSSAEPYELTVPAGSRETVFLDNLPGLSGQDVSTLVQSDEPIVAERAMYFDYRGRDGGHSSIGYCTAGTEINLAEGYTSPEFDTYVLVQNPGTEATDVSLEFQLDNGNTVDPFNFNLDGESRRSVRLNDLPGLSNAGVSTTVKAGGEVVAERSEYFDYYGKDGGSCSIGKSNAIFAGPTANTKVSEGVVTIEFQGIYYEVTIDMTKGVSHYQVGKQYGKAIKKILGNFEYTVGPYLSEIAGLMAYEYKVAPWTLVSRANTIKKNLPPDYQDELDGLISSLHGTVLWSKDELINLYNLIPDVCRGTSCSAFAAWGASSYDGSTIAQRNLDWFVGINGNELNSIQAVTKYHYATKDVYLIGALGNIGCITGVSRKAGDNSSGIMGAILDSGVDNTKYSCDGKRSYNFDLRYGLDNLATKEQIADYMKNKPYTYSHLIFLVDKGNARILENNISGQGSPAQRALRTDTSLLNDPIHWGYPSMIGAVNCFALKGQVNNYSSGENSIVNPKRWQLLRTKIEERYTSVNKYKLTQKHVNEIMSSYWGSKPQSIYFDEECGDLYNKDTVQMVLYVPALNSLKVFFKPFDGSTPLSPKFVPITY